jgi:hypothetical protein
MRSNDEVNFCRESVATLESISELHVHTIRRRAGIQMRRNVANCRPAQ